MKKILYTYTSSKKPYLGFLESGDGISQTVRVALHFFLRLSYSVPKTLYALLNVISNYHNVL